jgi:DHA2 family multidrug resistance protein
MAMFGMGVMIGPILGPVLGGWLTENYSWRWVFLVNLPVGVLCTLLLLRFMPASDVKKREFDLFGFSLLAVALGAFQIMLDRGADQDWFSSWEICIEAALAAGGTWMFLVQLATGRRPLFDPKMFADRNFGFSLFFMVVTGVLLLAGLALLPPLLQQLYGYSVLDAGFLTAPRGIGTLVSMMLAGRLTGKIDARFLIFAGIGFLALSLWQMSAFTLVMGSREIIISGVVQGLGLGFIFVPLQSLAFASLPASYRTTGASLLNLCRNIGGSVGISVVTFLLARNVQVSHADLAQHITTSVLPGVIPPGGPGSPGGGDPTGLLGPAGQAALQMVDGEINRQALMIAYLDDFRLMMWVCVAAMPLVWLLRPAKQQGGGPPVITD